MKSTFKACWRDGALAVLVSIAATTTWAGSCTVTSTGLAFGAYQPINFGGKLLSSAKTSDATVSVNCTGVTEGGSYSIALGPSPAGNSISPRYLANSNGGPFMAFNIYSDVTHLSVWGDGFVSAMLGGTLPPGDSNHSHTVFGKIPAGQYTLRPGSFTGTLSMTLTYNP